MMAIKEVLKREAKLFFLKNKRNILQIRGRSMYPTLQEDWNAEISPAKERDLKIGDIIVFVTGEELTVHRIVAKINRNGKVYLLQKGDNESMPHFIEGCPLIGKVTRVFNCEGEEIPSRLWKSPNKNEIAIFNLFNILYFILYRIKKIIFGNKRNNLVRFIRTFYWKLFLGVLKKRQKK